MRWGGKTHVKPSTTAKTEGQKERGAKKIIGLFPKWRETPSSIWGEKKSGIQRGGRATSSVGAGGSIKATQVILEGSERYEKKSKQRQEEEDLR